MRIMDASTMLMAILLALGAIVWWRALALALGAVVVALVILGVVAVMEQPPAEPCRDLRYPSVVTKSVVGP